MKNVLILTIGAFALMAAPTYAQYVALGPAVVVAPVSAPVIVAPPVVVVPRPVIFQPSPIVTPVYYPPPFWGGVYKMRWRGRW